VENNLLTSLKNIPDSSGVYQYFDKNQKLLYVGKAKSLKKRVKSYFRVSNGVSPAPNLSPRIHKMICEVYFLNYILSDSEAGALILENSLIKQLKPKYNILLRDDKTFPYIYIDKDDDFPRFEITRKILKGKGILYFGPYTTGAREIIDSLYEVFPLVQKKNCLKGKKSCLFYQINKCLAPCEGMVSKERYAQIVKEAIKHLKNLKELNKKLEAKMYSLAEQERFEEAAEMRDKINKIASIKDFSSFDIAKNEDLDIIAIVSDKTDGVVVRMFMRDGKIVSSSHTFFKSTDGIDESDGYKMAILNFYTEHQPLPPSEILLPLELEESRALKELVAKNIGKSVKIVAPKIGDKKNLVDIAIKNGYELLKIEGLKKGEDDLAEELQELLGLQNRPDRIETFDTSQLFGQGRVGSMVVYEDGFIKSDFRHYNLEAKDDYSMMDEMLKRRVASFEKNPPPDLWVLDGGKGQLNVALRIIDSFGANVDVIAISKEKLDSKAHRAKGAAKDIIYTKENKFELSTNDKRLQFIQKLRDEAHRFAIEFFRKQKLKTDKEFEILKIAGVSEARMKKLLNYFGTFENIKNSTFEELATIVGAKVASEIKARFLT